MTEYPQLSVLIAVRNEGHHLSSTLEGLCSQLESGVAFETLVLDGMSTDDTAQVVNNFEKRLPNLQLVNNVKILAAAGWNLGLQESRAPRIIILSGHAHLPQGYFKMLIEKLTPDRSGVSGVAVPVGSTYTGHLISKAFASRLGNGGASFMQSGKAGPVESIAFGCYWRKDLIDVGGFDESVVRGQDWDLNLRLRAVDKILWLEPGAIIRYNTRSDFSSLWRRQYMAGLWKFFIHRKNKTPLLPRHLVPGVFSVSLILPLLLSGLNLWFLILPAFILLVHVIATILQYRKMQLSASDFRYFWLALFIIHFAYGFGLLKGYLFPPLTLPIKSE